MDKSVLDSYNEAIASVNEEIEDLQSVKRQIVILTSLSNVIKKSIESIQMKLVYESHREANNRTYLLVDDNIIVNYNTKGRFFNLNWDKSYFITPSYGHSFDIYTAANYIEAMYKRRQKEIKEKSKPVIKQR